MAKRNPQLDESWAHAKRVCRLNGLQVEMAKRLGMNPKKLQGLNPAKSQPWKEPVGAFIEACHAKRFGSVDPKHSSSAKDPRRPSTFSSVDFGRLEEDDVPF